MTPRAPARARLPLLRFRPGGIGLDGATRGAENQCNPLASLDAVTGTLRDRVGYLRSCCPGAHIWRIRLVAYGARLESVLGESPRGFESPILRQWKWLAPSGRAFLLCWQQTQRFDEEGWGTQPDGVPHPPPMEKARPFRASLSPFLAINTAIRGGGLGNPARRAPPSSAQHTQPAPRASPFMASL